MIASRVRVSADPQRQWRHSVHVKVSKYFLLGRYCRYAGWAEDTISRSILVLVRYLLFGTVWYLLPSQHNILFSGACYLSLFAVSTYLGGGGSGARCARRERRGEFLVDFFVGD